MGSSEVGAGAVSAAPATERTVAQRFAVLVPMIRSRARPLGSLDRDDVEQELAAKAWQCTLKFASRCNDVQLRNLVSHVLKHKMIDLIRRAEREPRMVEWIEDFEADDYRNDDYGTDDE